MADSSIRITPETSAALHELAREMNLPVREVAARAVEAYRREQFVEHANASYAALQADSAAWQDELDDRAAWGI